MTYNLYQTYGYAYERLTSQHAYPTTINSIEYMAAIIPIDDPDMHYTVYEIDYSEEAENVGIIVKTYEDISNISLFLLFKQKRIFVFHEDYTGNIKQIVGRYGNPDRGSFFKDPYQDYKLVTLNAYMDLANSKPNIVSTLERANPIEKHDLIVTNNSVNVMNSDWTLREGVCFLLITAGMSQSEHATINISEWGEKYPKFWYLKLTTDSSVPVYFHNSFKIELNSVQHSLILPNITIGGVNGLVDIVLVQEDAASPVTGFIP